MTLKLIDSHIHLDAEAFDADREKLIFDAQKIGISNFITIGAGNNLDSAKAAIALAEKYDFIYATVGLHPHDAKIEVDIKELNKLAKHKKVLAIGETGLDFYRDWAPRDLQDLWFRAQIQLALEVNKPIIIHSRNASKECLQILIELKAQSVGGVFHCYSETADFAKELKRINFLVSFPGSITFKNATLLRYAAKEIPMEQILIETDAPYLAPEPKRGKRCEPAYLIETAKKLAEIKGISLEQVAKVTYENTRKLFKF